MTSDDLFSGDSMSDILHPARFEGDVREIFDVQVLHGLRFPELLELDSPLVPTSFTVPTEALPEFGISSATR